MDTEFSISNRILADLNLKRRSDFAIDPKSIYPWLRRCTINTLIVTDGILNFGNGDFGLSAFLTVLLNDRPTYADFRITLGHLASSVAASDMFDGDTRIANRITGFRFDDATHFTPDMYDEVWMFGVETSYHNGGYVQRGADPARYPASSLGVEELKFLSAHMDRGGGVFATGDHGALGVGLGGSVKRVRNMRHWNSFTGPSGLDEVSMGGPQRNDTNSAGHDTGTQFSDQSDDVPQTLDLKLYSSRIGRLTKARWPHPVLCGRNGMLNVLPDHPHEGECQVPDDLSLTYDLDGSKEYPDATDGSGQVVPEIIATSRVPAGNTADRAGSKQPTNAHTFGAISAYDGHRAGVGRVICDATWHHFVNVNIIGVVEGGIFDQFADTDHAEDASKHDGFLSSSAGKAAFDKIKNYYTNIGVWVAPPQKITCFRGRFWWLVLYKERVMEAALLNPDIEFKNIPVGDLRAIGIHARDVLGRAASPCQMLEFIIDFVTPIWPEVPIWVNPWHDKVKIDKEPLPLPLPVFDPLPLIDVALGGALVAMRQAFPFPPEKPEMEFEKRARDVADEGAKTALSMALENVAISMKDFSQTLRAQMDRG